MEEPEAGRVGEGQILYFALPPLLIPTRVLWLHQTSYSLFTAFSSFNILLAFVNTLTLLASAFLLEANCLLARSITLILHLNILC